MTSEDKDGLGGKLKDAAGSWQKTHAHAAAFRLRSLQRRPVHMPEAAKKPDGRRERRVPRPSTLGTADQQLQLPQQ